MDELSLYGNGGGANCSASVSGNVLSATGWSATTNTAASGSDVAANVMDGNLATRFSSDEAQASGDYLRLDLGSAQNFSVVDMQVPNSSADYARAYSVEVSPDGSNWTTVAMCTGTSSSEIVSFPTQSARYVEMALNASASPNWWSVDELSLYGPNPSVSCSAHLTGTMLASTGWVASTNTPASVIDAPGNAIDGNLTTRFSTDEAQSPGYYLRLDLGSTRSFSALDMEVPNSAGDYARGYTVQVSPDATTWTTVASCTGSGPSEVLDFPVQSARYVQISLTAAVSPNWWSVDELDLLH